MTGESGFHISEGTGGCSGGGGPQSPKSRQRAAGPTLERSPAPVSSRRSRSAAAAPKSRARRASRARSAATRVFVLRGRIRGLRLNIGVDQESLMGFRLFYMQYHTVQYS